MWTAYLVVSSLFGVVRDILTKKITQHLNPLVSLLYFYITAIITAAGISIFYYNSNPFLNDTNSWIVRVFGIAFGLGVYGFFNSIKLSLTKTQTYTNYRNLVSIGLAYLFLGELKGFTWQTAIALVIFVLALVLPHYFKKTSTDEKKLEKEWFFWMALNVIFIGSGLFFVKLFTKNMLPIDVLTNQYIGSFSVIGLIILLRNTVFKAKMGELKLTSEPKYIYLSFLNGVITALSLFCLYVAISLNKVSLVTQMDNFIRTLLIVPIGLFILKENKTYTTIDYVSLGLALVGAMLLIFA